MIFLQSRYAGSNSCQQIATLDSVLCTHRPEEALNAEEGRTFMWNDAVGISPDDRYDAKLHIWLRAVGLQFNPFDRVTFNSTDDPRLGEYVVGHEAFTALWGNWVSTVLAPTGGGKSAFRVRLSYAARIGEDGRHVFPIIYAVPQYAKPLDSHLEAMAENAAYELLLEVVHRPNWFDSLPADTQRLLRWTLDHNAPGWTRFLDQIHRKGSIAPLAEMFDRSASRLPNSPSAERVRDVCSTLRNIPSSRSILQIEKRWEELTILVIDKLKFESIHILVDGADAYPETVRQPDVAITWLAPLLAQVPTWSTSYIFLKMFLPIELQASLEGNHKNLLTFPARFVKMIWTPERLAEVLAARLRVASVGEFDSLDALCSPALRGLNSILANIVQPAVPREVIALAERVVFEHVRRDHSSELLQPEDLDAAREWYRLDRLIARSP